ncbi:MAG: RHS repeat-associated core domain-containing protein [Bacteroidales bacterium]|jgi:RHS repeat-associated protein|nr:RHS repeat-associated core domain-containing protein [Bacteroidales bacterium]
MRGFAIEYNLLNLPAKIRKGGDSIEYVYSAKGEKLAKKKNGAVVNYYCGNMVYKADLTPDYVIHPEGLALYSGGAYGFQFNLTDHLGNVRTVLNASAAVQQANDYFPFGLTHATVANIAKNKYLYNGKELQDDVLGGIAFDQLDYGARFYDPVIGRWHAVDPMAEQNRRWSPYAYCYNNPLRFVDPDGMRGIFRPVPRPINYNNRQIYTMNRAQMQNRSFQRITTYQGVGQRGGFSPAYVETYTTAGGNSSQMSAGNNTGRNWARAIESGEYILKNVSIFINASNSSPTMETKNSIVFSNPADQTAFNNAQNAYEQEYNTRVGDLEAPQVPELNATVSERQNYANQMAGYNFQKILIKNEMGISPKEQVIRNFDFKNAKIIKVEEQPYFSNHYFNIIGNEKRKKEKN